MAIYRLRREQLLPAPPEKIWHFFSDASNLSNITPKHMGFNVTSGTLPGDVYPGQIITYTVSPILGIPLFWMTEITAVEKNRFFVDEQRRGPYSLWHHQHLFEERDGGTLMTDLVHYEVPLGFLGTIAHGLFVKAQLQKIFDFRAEAVGKEFGGNTVSDRMELTKL